MESVKREFQVKCTKFFTIICLLSSSLNLGMAAVAAGRTEIRELICPSRMDIRGHNNFEYLKTTWKEPDTDPQSISYDFAEVHFGGKSGHDGILSVSKP